MLDLLLCLRFLSSPRTPTASTCGIQFLHSLQGRSRNVSTQQVLEASKEPRADRGHTAVYPLSRPATGARGTHRGAAPCLVRDLEHELTILLRMRCGIWRICEVPFQATRASWVAACSYWYRKITNKAIDRAVGGRFQHRGTCNKTQPNAWRATTTVLRNCSG